MIKAGDNDLQTMERLYLALRKWKSGNEMATSADTYRTVVVLNVSVVGYRSCLIDPAIPNPCDLVTSDECIKPPIIVKYHHEA